MKAFTTLSAFPLVATDSVEKAEAMLSRSLTTCRIGSVADRRRFHMQMNGLEIGRTSLVYNRYGSDSKVETELPGEPVFFNLGNDRPSNFRFGNRSVTTHSNRPAMIADHNRMEIDRPENSEMLILRAWLPDLEQQLEKLTHRHHRGRLVFDANADLKEGAGASLRRLMHFLVSELEDNSPLVTNPQFKRTWDEMLLNALLSLPHNRKDLLFDERDNEVSPGLVHRAQEYMRANLNEAITVSDLTRLCQCSQSTLFYAFRNAKGYTPMEFLTEQRLQSARHDLNQPTPTTSVSSVAIENGFVHLGRFSCNYRKRFGERPSETLKTARFRC